MSAALSFRFLYLGLFSKFFERKRFFLADLHVMIECKGILKEWSVIILTHITNAVESMQYNYNRREQNGLSTHPEL